MRRIWLLVCGIAITVTGCTSGSTTPATVTVTATPTSEEAASTEQTNDILASQFHPCEVLTQEQFEKAGLIGQMGQSTDLGTLALGCSFGGSTLDEYSGIWLVSTDKVNRKYVSQLNLETIDWGTINNSEIYVQEVSENIRQCEAVVDYEWGRLTVTYFETGEGWEPEVLCPGAVQILDNLIEEIEGTE